MSKEKMKVELELTDGELNILNTAVRKYMEGLQGGVLFDSCIRILYQTQQYTQND